MELEELLAEIFNEDETCLKCYWQVHICAASGCRKYLPHGTVWCEDHVKQRDYSRRQSENGKKIF